MEKPRDITYCANRNCTRNCERNLLKHDFRGAGPYSVTKFGPDKSGECKFFIKRGE